MKIIKIVSIIIMSIFYIKIGIDHFNRPEWYLHIIPPYLMNYGLELVYLSGWIEIILGLALLIPEYRKLAAYSIILLLIALYPANIYLAFNQEPQQLINISSFIASWVRLPLQFVFISIAYYHSK